MFNWKCRECGYVEHDHVIAAEAHNNSMPCPQCGEPFQISVMMLVPMETPRTIIVPEDVYDSIIPYSGMAKISAIDAKRMIGESLSSRNNLWVDLNEKMNAGYQDKVQKIRTQAACLVDKKIFDNMCK